MATGVARCSAIVNDLLQLCTGDTKRSLQSLLDSLQRDFQPATSDLVKDLEQLLILFRDQKRDISWLWSEVRDLKDRIKNLRSWADASDQLLHEERQLHRTEIEELRRDARDRQTRLEDTESSLVDAHTAIKDLQTRLEDTESVLSITRTTLATARMQFALRQVLHALNEKLLALVRKKLGMETGAFWEMYAANNIGKLQGHQFEPIWQELQKEYGITQQADMYWRRLKGCKLPLDIYVHAESWDPLSYEELRAQADVFYVGSKAVYKRAFLEALELNKRISDATNTTMYDGNV